jgi:thymidine kinase
MAEAAPTVSQRIVTEADVGRGWQHADLGDRWQHAVLSTTPENGSSLPAPLFTLDTRFGDVLAAIHASQQAKACPGTGMRNRNKSVLVLGPMFAGKSKTLEHYARRKKHLKKHVIFACKPKADTRDEADTHDGTSLWHTVQRFDTAADIISSLAFTVSCLAKDTQLVVLVDEGQMFADLADLVRWVYRQEQSITLMIAALSGDFQLQCFPSVAAVLPLVDKIKLLSAICMDCGEEDAPFSRMRAGVPLRTSTDGRVSSNQPGGAEKYAACCKQCWRDPTSETPVKPAGESLAPTVSALVPPPPLAVAPIHP